jgi:hypothetical protein
MNMTITATEARGKIYQLDATSQNHQPTTITGK